QRNFPRTRALRPFGALRFDRDTWNIVETKGIRRPLPFGNFRIRGDADLREIDSLKRRAQIFVYDVDDGRRFKRGADALLYAFDFERPGDDTADTADFPPFFCKRFIAPGLWRLREGLQMHRAVIRRKPCEPDFFRCKAENWRKPNRETLEQMIQHSEASLARDRRDRLAVERVLANVKVKCRKVGSH